MPYILDDLDFITVHEENLKLTYIYELQNSIITERGYMHLATSGNPIESYQSDPATMPNTSLDLNDKLLLS